VIVIDTQGRVYEVALIDPPWGIFKARSDKGMRRDASRRYPVLSVAEICALSIPLAQNGTVYLWTLAYQPPETVVQVLCAWGVEKRTEIVWDKGSPGKGLRVRGCHETMIIATRGRPPKLAYRPSSVIHAPRPSRLHSAKPEIFAEIIDQIHPGQSKIELFARTCRPGWDAWGDEIGGFVPATREFSTATREITAAGHAAQAEGRRCNAGPERQVP
jgi:N6-adenosine-specific RNA methylase IME4